MLLPYINEIPTTRTWNDVFYGYNHNLRIAEGEFYDMKNMTGDDFPVLSPRGKRGIRKGQTTNPCGLISKDALCWVDDGKFYINGTAYDLGLSTDTEYDEAEGAYKLVPKKLISMGAYVIILPDKKYINTSPDKAETDWGSIEETFTSSGEVAFQMSMLDGTAYTTVVGGVAPTITEAMLRGEEEIPVWIDTSSKPSQFKMYSTATETWSAVATSYVKIIASGIGAKKFSVGDAVTISGVTFDGAKAINDTSAVITSFGDNFIVVAGSISDVGKQDTAITITRAMPEMQFVCESGNRLWGCYYGIKDGKMVNEIYASKLGDFKNWNVFQGTAADSYAVTVGTDGEFTGATTHLGYPIFFKENYMHKIYGNYPSNYQVQTTACRGVQKGCGDSIATVNEILYYKARSGIVAYDGSLPVEISGALGDESYDRARAGWLGNKYYVSMRDSKDQYHLFVYDTKRAMWHREDETEAVCFCNSRGDLYYIDYADRQIKGVRGIGCESEEPSNVEWEAVTGVLGTDSPDKKYISRLDVRMKLTPGAVVSFYAEYDSSGEWEHLFNMTGVDLKSFAVPVRPKRCDHMRIKIHGVGDAKIFSVCKTIEGGSDK
jgi:hypothetical protein